jgi:hypothetical protein
MKDYFKLCGFNDSVKAAMVASILEEKDIPVNIINKQDSNYVFLGESDCLKDRISVVIVFIV